MSRLVFWYEFMDIPEKVLLLCIIWHNGRFLKQFLGLVHCAILKPLVNLILIFPQSMRILFILFSNSSFLHSVMRLF